MVCFSIQLAYPYPSSDKANIVQEMRLEHLCKHYNVDIYEKNTIDNIVYITVAACNNDAIAFLRDVPQPISCVYVKFHKSEVYLYKNYTMLRETCIPPRNLFLKKVYWNASQLQRWSNLVSRN